jgi:hypothetical protein
VSTTKRRLCLPFNGERYWLDRLVDDFGEHVYEFYGDDSTFVSGRRQLDFSDTPAERSANLEYAVKRCADAGIGFDYTMNSLNARQYDPTRTNDLFHRLADVGVKTVTVSYPDLVPEASRSGLEVVVSSIVNVTDPVTARSFAALGASRVVLSTIGHRHVRRMQQIKRESGLDVEVIVTNQCRLGCPYKTAHNATGDDGFFHVFCFPAPTFAEFLQGGWVRPRDFDRYQELGVDFFKVTQRNDPGDVIYTKTQRLTSGKTTYLKYVGEFYGLKGYSEDDFDEFFDFVLSGGCDTDCDSCGFCTKFAAAFEEKFGCRD